MSKPAPSPDERATETRGAKAVRSLCLSGLWTVQVWITLLTFGNARLDNGLFSIDLSLGLALIVIALVLGRRPQARIPERVGDALDAIAAILMCSPALLSLVAPESDTLAIVGVVAGGGGLAWAYNRWGSTYLRLGTRETFRYIFGSFMVTAVVKAVLILLPPPVQNLMMAVLAVMTFVLVRRAQGLVGHTEPVRRYKEQSALELAGLGACVMVFSCVCNAMRVYLRTCVPDFNVGAQLLICTYAVELAYFGLMYFLVVYREHNFGFMRLWGTVLVALATSILLSAIPGAVWAAYLFSGVAIDLISAYFWLGLVDIARHGRWNPAITFAAGWGAYAIAKLAGKLLVHFSAGAALGELLPTAMLWVVAVATVGCMGSRSSMLARIFSDLDDAVFDPADFAAIDERCEGLAVAYGLTARETDVMKELCKGRSKQFIAESLFISENTVRGHTKRLYAKLGIHSREELQDRVGV